MGAPPAEVKERQGVSPHHLAILERYGGRRGAQALALIAAGQVLWPIAQKLMERFNAKEDFSITVPGVDALYPDLHEWVLDRMPEKDRKALIASTDAGTFEPEDKGELRLRYDGSRSQVVRVGEHKVTVKVEREDIPERVNLADNWRRYTEKIVFVATTIEGREAVVEMIAGLLKAKRGLPEPPALHMPASWGPEWRRRGDLPPRTLDSTILKRNQLERLVDDLGTFLAREDEYNRLSLPWHRGYLFHGAPGTGKTTVARALANHFDLPTYYLPLGDIDKDADLTQYVAAIAPRSVLLLEDIDNFHSATERSDEKGKASLAAMLNALDGVWTPHGLITVMTTNHRDKLDEALVRPGRISVEEEFTTLSREQAQRIADFFGVEGFDPQDWIHQSPSALVESLIRDGGFKCSEASGSSLSALP